MEPMDVEDEGKGEVVGSELGDAINELNDICMKYCHSHDALAVVGGIATFNENLRPEEFFSLGKHFYDATKQYAENINTMMKCLPLIPCVVFNSPMLVGTYHQTKFPYITDALTVATQLQGIFLEHALHGADSQAHVDPSKYEKRRDKNMKMFGLMSDAIAKSHQDEAKKVAKGTDVEKLDVLTRYSVHFIHLQEYMLIRLLNINPTCTEHLFSPNPVYLGKSLNTSHISHKLQRQAIRLNAAFYISAEDDNRFVEELITKKELDKRFETLLSIKF